MNKVFLRLYIVLEDAVHALKRFPLAMLFSALAAAAAAMRLDVSDGLQTLPESLPSLFHLDAETGFLGLLDNGRLLVSFFAASCLGAALNVLLVVARERFRISQHWHALIISSGVLVPLGVFLILFLGGPADGLNLSRVYAASGIICIAGLLLPAFQSENFSFNTLCFIGIKAFFLSSALGAALFGIAFSLASLIDRMFDLRISGNVYLYLAIPAAMLFVSCFLGYFPSCRQDVTDKKYYTSSRYSPVLEAVFSYAGVSFYGIYSIIMAIYAANILLWNKWPVNRVAMYFLVYMATGTCLYIVLTPLNNRLARFFRRTFPITLLLSVLMSGYALYLRIGAYAFTTLRYFAVCVWLGFVVTMLALLFRGRNGTKIIAVYLAVVLLVSVLPVFNYKNISVYSQILRVESIYRKYGLINKGKIAPSPDLSLYDKNEVAKAVEYIADNKGVHMAKWLPANFNYASDFQKVFGFSQYDWYVYEPTTYEFLPDSRFLSTAGYDIVGTPDERTVFSGIRQEFTGKNGRYLLEISSVKESGLQTFNLIFKRNGRILVEESLTGFLDALKAYLKKAYEQGVTTYVVPQSMMLLTYKAKDATLCLFLDQVILADESDVEYAQGGTSISIQSILLKE